MEQLTAFLGISFQIGDQTITVLDILVAPTVLCVGWLLLGWAARTLRNRLTARSVNADIIHLIIRAFNIVGLGIIGITMLDILNVPLTAFAFISGAVAIGIGFGAQNIINNFISGWILMWERPIRIGDFLEIGDTKGRVEAINARSTRIRRIDGVHLLIPNSHLLENTVVNWTLVDRLTRSEVKVGVAYGSPAKQVAELLEQLMMEQQDILQDPAAVVYFEDFGDNALLFGAYFWINATSEKDVRQIRSELRFGIDALFREHNISIAFPQRDIHVDGAITITRPVAPAGHETPTGELEPVLSFQDHDSKSHAR